LLDAYLMPHLTRVAGPIDSARRTVQAFPRKHF